MHIRLIALGVAWGVIGCGTPEVATVGISNPQEAAAATHRVSNSMATMKAQMARQLAFSQEYTGTCGTSGTAKVKATVSVNGILATSAAVGATETVTITADHCFHEKDFRVSGNVTW